MRDLFLVIFLSLCLSIFLHYSPSLGFGLNYKVGLIIAFIVGITFRFGWKNSAYSLFIIGLFHVLDFVRGIQEIGLQLGIFFLGLYFIYEQLGTIVFAHISMKKVIGTLLNGIGLTLMLFAIVFLMSLSLLILGVHPDTANVSARIASFPLYIVLFAVAFAPISEEMFFRGFLSKRFGVLLSSIVFSISHILYGSIYELAGAFVIGMVLSYYFLRTKNLAACMVAHALFNFTSITIMFLLRGVSL